MQPNLASCDSYTMITINTVNLHRSKETAVAATTSTMILLQLMHTASMSPNSMQFVLTGVLLVLIIGMRVTIGACAVS